MARLILFNKPYRVLSQFSKDGDKKTLADYLDIRKIYPAGRLDYDSEGLLLLTANGALQHYITDPTHRCYKTYRLQVEGRVNRSALKQLKQGVELNDGLTQPARVRLHRSPPLLWQRHPPIRQRKNIPTCWLDLSIYEGRNRQIKRMLAAVGHPVLRLVRIRVGDWLLGNLAPGQWMEKQVDVPE